MSDWTGGPDKVSEVAFEHGPEELGESSLWQLKEFLIALETVENSDRPISLARLFQKGKLSFSFIIGHVIYQHLIEL
jgi:hypothetical protein